MAVTLTRPGWALTAAGSPPGTGTGRVVLPARPGHGGAALCGALRFSPPLSPLSLQSAAARAEPSAPLRSSPGDRGPPRGAPEEGGRERGAGAPPPPLTRCGRCPSRRAPPPLPRAAPLGGGRGRAAGGGAALPSAVRGPPGGRTPGRAGGGGGGGSRSRGGPGGRSAQPGAVRLRSAPRQLGSAGPAPR